MIDYNQVPKGHRMQKLYDVLNCVRCGISPFCTIETAMPHVAVFNALQEYPVAPVPEGQVRTWEQDGDHFWAVNGLEEKMLEAYEQEKLLIL